MKPLCRSLKSSNASGNHMATDWKQTFQDFRDWIARIPVQNGMPTRPCEFCGVECYLHLGRHSKKYFYGHPVLTECERGRAFFYDTAAEAVAGKMFHKFN